MQSLRHFLLAVQFFSRIPVSGRLASWVGWSPALQRASAGHLPGVGWLVGLWAALLLGASLWLLPTTSWTPLVAALLSTAGTLWLTGGFHEDGLADVADGLGGMVPPEGSQPCKLRSGRDPDALHRSRLPDPRSNDA